ncbi:hypothetical protein Mapa_016455 [Marchantia paleacea]|nr:hypothetical protein Mapa_016455 [Marchantia paleacea]
MADNGRITKFSPRLPTCAALVLLQLVLFVENAAGVLDFYVWNGLDRNLKVGDQPQEVPPGQFLVYTKDEIDSEYYEYMAPVVDGLEDVNCETRVMMNRVEFQFRSAGISDGIEQNDGWVVYVYQWGFFPPPDNLGTGSPLYTWPAQVCIFE